MELIDQGPAGGQHQGAGARPDLFRHADPVGMQRLLQGQKQRLRFGPHQDQGFGSRSRLQRPDAIGRLGQSGKGWQRIRGEKGLATPLNVSGQGSR
jgi:hypothetical protein